MKGQMLGAKLSGRSQPGGADVECVGQFLGILNSIVDHQVNIIDDLLPGRKNQALKANLPFPHVIGKLALPPGTPLVVVVGAVAHETEGQVPDLHAKLAPVLERTRHKAVDLVGVIAGKLSVGDRVDAELQSVAGDFGRGCKGRVGEVPILFPFEETTHGGLMELVENGGHVLGAKLEVAVVAGDHETLHAVDCYHGLVLKGEHGSAHLGGRQDPPGDDEGGWVEVVLENRAAFIKKARHGPLLAEFKGDAAHGWCMGRQWRGKK